jgi:hypothetical protein
VRIPGGLRDLQVERESLFLDFSSQRLFHSLDLFFRQRPQQLSFRAVVTDAMSCDSGRPRPECAGLTLCTFAEPRQSRWNLPDFSNMREPVLRDRIA